MLTPSIRQATRYKRTQYCTAVCCLSLAHNIISSEAPLFYQARQQCWPCSSAWPEAQIGGALPGKGRARGKCGTEAADAPCRSGPSTCPRVAQWAQTSRPWHWSGCTTPYSTRPQACSWLISSCAARWPDVYAPCIVPMNSLLVASPAFSQPHSSQHASFQMHVGHVHMQGSCCDHLNHACLAPVPQRYGTQSLLAAATWGTPAKKSLPSTLAPSSFTCSGVALPSRYELHKHTKLCTQLDAMARAAAGRKGIVHSCN